MASVPADRLVTEYRLVRRRATAAAFHAQPIPDPPEPEIWVHEIVAPALVLGSTQRDDMVDRAACAAAGVDVVRRRSGGGAVLLRPGEVVWVDVIVPAGSVGWAPDIHRPMVWLGEHLTGVLTALGVDGVGVHRGGIEHTEWSRLVCFDGLGPGEVTVGEHKLVGISQRRTRAAARLQACWYSGYDSAALVRFLDVDVDAAVLRSPATVPADIALAVPARLRDALSATS